MAKTDFKPVMIRNVEFKYPRLNACYRYNTSEKKSEECAPTASNAAYSIAWEMQADEAKTLHAELKAHYETCQTKAPFGKIFGMKKLDSGNYEFRAKRNGTNSQGQQNEKPRVIDGMKQPLADTAFWGGSKGSIKVTAYPVTDPDGMGAFRWLFAPCRVRNAGMEAGGLVALVKWQPPWQGGVEVCLDGTGRRSRRAGG